MRTIITFFIIFLFCSINTFSLEKPSRSKKVIAYRLEKGVKLDGKLQEEIWKNKPVGGFIQRDPEEGSKASESTSVWMAYDDNYIYVAAKLYDSHPELIDKSLMRRDSGDNSDWFYFFVDPYLDRRTGYYFAVNPGGSREDGTIFNDSWTSCSWDGIWEVETNIDETGWTLEMRIPLSQLRFKESEKMTWGVNYSRDIKRKNEYSYFVMVPKKESGFVSRFATLEGLDGIKPKQRLEVLPYLVQKAQYLKHDAGDPYYKGNQYETAIGGDFKVGMGSNLTVDGTINPDFGQVEVDPAVVNLSAFETYYDEKRPFFVEGEDVFRFGFGGVNNNWGFNFGTPDLYYSRRIGRSPQGSTSDCDFEDYPSETRILGAAKLTGKVADGWSLGVMTAHTERTYSRLCTDGKRSKEEVEPYTHYFVARSKKEFSEGRHALGVIFTGVNRDLVNQNLREELVKGAYNFGLDGWTTLDNDETYVMNGSIIGSYVHGTKEAIQEKQERSYRYFQRPDASFMRLDRNRTSLHGIYSRVMLNKQKGNFYINTALGMVTPGFENNDLGFQWMADRINGHMVLGYRWFEPDNIFRRKSIYLSHFESYNFDGDKISNGLMTFTNFTFLNYYSVGVNISYNWGEYSPSLTRGGPVVKRGNEFYVSYNFSTDRKKEFVFGTDGDYWTHELGGNGKEINLSLEWRPNPQIFVSFGPGFERNMITRQWIDSFEDATATHTYGKRYVFGEMTQETISGNIRLNWTFTPQLSLQLFLQPLFSVGKYDNFKELAKPRSMEHNIYGENGSTISYDSKEEEYTVDPDGSGVAKTFSFDNPDFNFKSLRGNMVLRYEVLPGSVFYLVWTHNKTNDMYPGRMRIGRDFEELWNEEADNIFMIKYSHWLDI